MFVQVRLNISGLLASLFLSLSPWASSRFGDGSVITAETGNANWVNRGRIKFSRGHLCDDDEGELPPN